jgi:hypothetical protein
VDKRTHLEYKQHVQVRDSANLNTLVGFPVGGPSGSSLLLSGYAAKFGTKFNSTAFDDFVGTGKTIPLTGPNGNVIAQATCTTDDNGLMVSAWLSDDVADSVQESVGAKPHGLALNYEMVAQALELPSMQADGTVFEPKAKVWKATPLSATLVPLPPELFDADNAAVQATYSAGSQ